MNMINVPQDQFPPITIRDSDCTRLGQLAEAIAEASPATAELLAREVERATRVPDGQALPGIVGMESEVVFRDDSTGQEKCVSLVYPNAADIDAGRISIATPIGAALIGLSAGQAMSFETPSGDLRSLTVLAVRDPA
jgi:regulator of nucleoside diphosphate kinase